MVRSLVGCVTTACLVGTAISASAGDFEIGIRVDLGDRQVATAATLESPSQQKPPPRPVAELDRDHPVNVSWHARNTGKSDEFKDVLMHFFVVREGKTGQAEVPKLAEDVAYEGALTMDFKPQDHADWQWALRIHEPGSYLLRVETIGLVDKLGHERYAAMDLIVK